MAMETRPPTFYCCQTNRTASGVWQKATTAARSPRRAADCCDSLTEDRSLPPPGFCAAVRRLACAPRSRWRLWIGTRGKGLVHIHRGRTDVFARSDGLSSELVASLFEDREGNIWVATVDGLDRFRELAVPTLSVKQGLSNPFTWPSWRRGMDVSGSGRPGA